MTGLLIHDSYEPYFDRRPKPAEKTSRYNEVASARPQSVMERPPVWRPAHVAPKEGADQ